MPGDREEYADSYHKREDGWTTIADERKRDSGEWYHIEVHTDIDTCLNEDKHSDARCDILRKRILDGACYHESPMSDEEVEEDEDDRSEESELFRDHREYEIPLDFREVSPFLYWFPESKTEESTAADGDESLLYLIILPVRIGFLYDCLAISEEVVDTLRDIGEAISSAFGAWELPYAIDRYRSEEAYKKRYAYIAYIASSDEIETDGDGCNDEYRTEVWLEDKEEEHNPDDSEEWEESFAEIVHTHTPSFHEKCQHNDKAYLHEFHRLKREWHTRDI